ncbi:hypothetical protein GCM10010342_77370 [Streptomyces anulatus]|nr:hypothetical protein GCM10010342_77370 [Streptomyces anulatus]
MGIRQTGAGAAGFSANWEFTKSDKLIAQQVLDFLADKRVLTVGRGRSLSEGQYCLDSTNECRRSLSAYLEQIQKPGGDLREWLRLIRASFVDFIEASGPEGRAFRPAENEAPNDDAFNAALLRLRDEVREITDAVAAKFKLKALNLPPATCTSASSEGPPIMGSAALRTLRAAPPRGPIRRPAGDELRPVSSWTATASGRRRTAGWRPPRTGGWAAGIGRRARSGYSRRRGHAATPNG